MTHTDRLKKLGGHILDACGRIYRPGVKPQDSLDFMVDWMGDKNALIGASITSFVTAIISFSLFAFFFACVFTVFTTALIFIIAKQLFYKPKEYSIELDNEKTILSFVKDIHINGESEVVVHSQPGYGKNKNTFVLIQLANSVSILDCRNISSVSDKTYRDIQIKFYHPAESDYSINATSDEGEVNFEVLEQNAEECRIKFNNPIRNIIKLDFPTSTS